MNNLKRTWDSHAESMSNKYKIPSKSELLNSKDFFYQWLSKLKTKGKLLDAGCGIGQYVTGSKILGFKSQGIDISPESVKIARKRGEKITLGDMRDLKFKDSSFNIVLAGGSIEHFPETDKALKEINRVLKNKGVFLMNVPYKYSLFILNKKLQQLFGLWKMGYEKSFSISEIKNKLEDNGFKILEIKKSEIGQGKRFPRLSQILNTLDKLSWNIRLGGHHIWFRCIKIDKK